MEKLKKWQTYVLLVVCILVNLIGRAIAFELQLPYWLDAIGTIIAAIQLGPLGGAVCGGLTNVLLGYALNNYYCYAVVSIGIGLSVGWFYPRGKKYRVFNILTAGVLTGFVAVILSLPFNIVLYGGKTGNVWGDGLIDMISRDVNVPIIYAFLGQVFLDVPDKALSVIIATKVIKIYHIINDRRQKPDVKTGALWLILPAALMLFSMQAKAIDISAEYAATDYDTDDGLATVEINAIAQTPDGYVWAGTYAGLYRCDGYKFEEAKLDERISNVMNLFVDSKGRLWIGTNDSGLVCYNSANKDITFYTMEEGLAADSVRAICEDEEGNIYAATVTQLCVISPEGDITVIDDNDVYGVRSLICNSQGIVAGVTNSGELFFMKDEEFIGKTMLQDEGASYGAIAASDHGDFLVGTTSNYVVEVSLDGNKVIRGKRYTTSKTSYYNKLYYSAENNGYFCCCENGCGFLTNAGKYTDMTSGDFNSSVGDIMVDYQGNVWFASNKQGIYKFSKNPFTDIFAKAKLDKEIVNCVHIKDGLLYVGTNNGLFTIDLKTYYSVPLDHPEVFRDTRIRDIMEDSQGNIWISTYGKYGLIEIKADGSMDSYNDRNKKTEGGKFRSTLELSDGTILAATSTGLNYIKNGLVMKTMGEAEGLNTQILNMVELGDGYVLAGTDGEGAVIIRDGEITHRYGKEQGLESLVILKIIPCGDGGYIYVTSNSLYYYKDHAVTRLNNFPYNNNYDVFLTDDGNAWIESSAGIYIVELDELIANEPGYKYTLLNRSRGLYSSLTANSRNTYYDGELYLCCADGVRRIAIEDDNFVDRDYSIRISKLLADNDEIIPDENGAYHIPATTGRITIDVALLNFTLSNPLVHIQLEGAGDDGIFCMQKEMQNLSYMDLPSGDYTLRVKVFDSAGTNVVREESFTVSKESQIFEKLYFKLYLATVCILFIMYLGWLVGNIHIGITSAERWQKEAKIDPMTGFWNKIYTEEELTRICEEKTGFLIMIDLDNFKLVNDVYGHEMGDKVLRGFADLVHSCTREDDFVGRIGGDEFLAFIQGASDESAITEKANYLNEQLIKKCEEILGNDMNIPIGVSIGAVYTGEEGGEYTELFRKADKALYNVKQNGKHGYQLYRDTSPVFAGAGDVNATGAAEIRKILEERGIQTGAYLVDLDKLQMVYRLFARMSKRKPVDAIIVQFSINSPDEGEVSEEILKNLTDIMGANLRSNDVMALNGKNQVIVILTDISSVNGDTPVNRILSEWNAADGHEGYELSYDYEVL